MFLSTHCYIHISRDEYKFPHHSHCCNHHCKWLWIKHTRSLFYKVWIVIKIIVQVHYVWGCFFSESFKLFIAERERNKSLSPLPLSPPSPPTHTFIHTYKICRIIMNTFDENNQLENLFHDFTHTVLLNVRSHMSPFLWYPGQQLQSV